MNDIKSFKKEYSANYIDVKHLYIGEKKFIYKIWLEFIK